MLLIRRIEITNFVCFDQIEIEPSTSREKPLTVIRAENGSGKTTLLRAIRWGMYGEKGLPGNASHFSLHPAEWRPDENRHRDERRRSSSKPTAPPAIHRRGRRPTPSTSCADR